MSNRERAKNKTKLAGFDDVGSLLARTEPLKYFPG